MAKKKQEITIRSSAATIGKFPKVRTEISTIKFFLIVEDTKNRASYSKF